MMPISKFLRAMGALAVLSLSACQMATNGPNESFDERTRFPVNVQPKMMTLLLPYDGNPASIDQNASTQIARFAADYLDHGSGAIAVSAPRRFRDAPDDVAARLVDLGVPHDRILIGNQDEPGANDSIKLTYIRYVAETPACGNWQADLGFTLNNEPGANFGCATSHNISAMIADPRDLVSPHPLTPEDAQRRLEVLEKYRKGQTTVAEKTQAQSGQVSAVAGGM